MRRIAFVLLLLMLGTERQLPQSSQSKTSFGTVYGVVVDERGTPLSHVHVKIDKLEMKTTDDGKFLIRGVPSGTVIVTFTLSDYNSSQMSAMVKPGETVRLDLSMQKKERVSSRTNNLLGLQMTQLTKEGMTISGSPSPDGQRLAIEVLDRGTFGWDIWLTSLKGRHKEILANTKEDESSPRWSPRGDAIVFSSYSYEERYRVWVKKILPQSRPEFIDKGLTPSWSSDGAWVVYAKLDDRNNWHIWKKELGGATALQLTSGDSQEQYPSWGIVDGRASIAFASTQGSGGKQFEIWTMNQDGSGQRQLTTSGLNLVGPAISPDGKMIACWSLQREPPNSVWIMRSDGTDLKKIVDNASNPQWLDATTLLLAAKISGEQQLWRAAVR